MLFGRLSLFSFAALIAIAVSLGYLFLPARSDSREEVEQNKKHHAMRTLERYPTYQQRETIEKLYWKKERSHNPWIQCKSNSSKLRLSQKKRHIECIEELSGVHCFLHNASDKTPSQLFAQSGVYKYPGHQFDLRSVQGNMVDLSQKMDVPCLSFSADCLHWEHLDQVLVLEGNASFEQTGQFALHADRAKLSFKEGTNLHAFSMQGNIRFFSPNLDEHPSFAVADVLFYVPETERFCLSSSKRVLFWQEGLSLSAPEIWIDRKEGMKIQSVGPANFHFTKEEQNIINQLLSHYL